MQTSLPSEPKLMKVTWHYAEITLLRDCNFHARVPILPAQQGSCLFCAPPSNCRHIRVRQGSHCKCFINIPERELICIKSVHVNQLPHVTWQFPAGVRFVWGDKSVLACIATHRVIVTMSTEKCCTVFNSETVRCNSLTCKFECDIVLASHINIWKAFIIFKRHWKALKTLLGC